MIDKKQFFEILKRKNEGTITSDELRFLEAYYSLFEAEEDVLDGWKESDKEKLKLKIEASLLIAAEEHEEAKQKKNSRILFYKWSAAAVFLLISGFSAFFYIQNLKKNEATIIAQRKVDFKPGGNNAKLILADGSVVFLDNAKDGKLASQSGIEITKAKDGQLVYAIKDNASSITNEIQYNTIETPKGGEYQVILPDGTKVWLNAASKIKFPLSFANLKKRKVELNGEAYFEVTKDKTKPFVVLSDLQAVQVYGTHFNVSAYTDESQTKTTLLEGSVKVVPISAYNDNQKVHSGEIFIKPGEQTTNTGNKIKLSKADTEQATAWKNGYFMFDEDNLENIMQKVCRWYNVEVDYKDQALRQVQFSGSVSRFENASQLLKVIELTGLVHFKVEGRRIVVMK